MQLLLDSVRQRSEATIWNVLLDDDRAVLEGDEMHLVTWNAGRFGRHHGIPTRSGAGRP